MRQGDGGEHVSVEAPGHSRPAKDHLLVAFAGLVILVVSALVASDGTVGAAERRVFHAVNDLPQWLYRPLWVFQQFGNLFVALALGVVIALLLRRWWVAGAVVGA